MRIASISVAAAASSGYLRRIGVRLSHSSVTMISTVAHDLWKKVGRIRLYRELGIRRSRNAPSADGKQRTLSLKGGGTVVERLEKLDNANHTYT